MGEKSNINEKNVAKRGQKLYKKKMTNNSKRSFVKSGMIHFKFSNFPHYGP